LLKIKPLRIKADVWNLAQAAADYVVAARFNMTQCTRTLNQKIFLQGTAVTGTNKLNAILEM
jgi:hypothetical protein